MSRQLAACLLAHKSLREAEAALAGTAVPERVFATAEGEAIRDDAFRRDVWARPSEPDSRPQCQCFRPRCIRS